MCAPQLVRPPQISLCLPVFCLLLLFISPEVPAQTTGRKHTDTTAAKSQAKKPDTSPKAATGQAAPSRGKDTTASRKDTTALHKVTPALSPSKEEEDDEDDSTAVSTEEGESRQDQKPDSTALKQNPANQSTSDEDAESDSTATPKETTTHAKAGKKKLMSEDEEESETAWELETKVDYDTWRIRRGVESGRGIPSLTPAAIITHESGLSAEFDAMSTYTKHLKLSLWSLILGYEYEFSDWVTCSFQFTRYRYTDSGENPEASKFNSWTLMGNFDAQICEIDFTGDLYPGTSPVIYLTFDVSKEFEAGDFSFTPTFEACYLDQKLHLDLPLPLKPRDLHIRTFATISLQCEIAWQATDQLSLSYNPQYIRFPVTEITSKVRGFASTLTVSYTFDF